MMTSKQLLERQRKVNPKDSAEKIEWARNEIARILDHLTPETANRLLWEEAGIVPKVAIDRQRLLATVETALAVFRGLDMAYPGEFANSICMCLNAIREAREVQP